MSNESYPHFSRRELASPDTGDHYVDSETMWLVEMLRENYWGKPMIIAPGGAYRTPEYNVGISSTGREGPHTTGKAIDVVICGAEVYRFLAEVVTLNNYIVEGEIRGPIFTGIGINQKGPHKSRFIHLDTLRDDETAGPRPWVWTY